jgi:hypothetical protein
LSTEPRPIKVANTASSETTRADEIAIKTAKASKWTAVVAVMSIFSEKRCKLRSANCGTDKPSCQKAESANFLEKNSYRPRKLSQKLRKGKKIASKSERIGINCTNLELNSKQTRSDHTKTPDPSISSGLKVKN